MKKKLLFYLLVFIFTFASAINVSATDESFDQMLEQLRYEFFSTNNFGNSSNKIPQIYFDGSEKTHTPPEYIVEHFDGISGFSKTTLEPYVLGDTRTFRNVSGVGTLSKQGERVNIWTINSDVDIQIDDAMITRFDEIIEAMETSVAPFGGVVVNTPSPNSPVVGDIHGDGRVNVLLHNHTGGGFFFSGDYSNLFGNEPIALIHVSSTLIGENRNNLYDTFAHEFQHLLFYQYFGVYFSVVMGGNAPVVSSSFSWFDESLSELSGFLFANPGSETIMISRNFSAVQNPYINPFDLNPSYGDLLNFNNSFKSYGMSRLHGTLMHRSTASYLNNVYGYFQTTLPPAESAMMFWINQNKIYTMLDMQTIVGNVFDETGLTGSVNATGSTAFELLYFIFMEAFAADTPVSFVNSPYSAHRLWGIRPSIGTSNNVYFDESMYSYPLTIVGGSEAIPIPELLSGESIIMSGYNGTTALGASHEVMFKLVGETSENSVLSVSVDDNDPFTRWYVAVPNDAPGSVSSASNRQFGSEGATIYTLKSGVQNYIDTGGQTAYLFAVTLYRNVSATVEYGWSDTVPSLTLTPQILTIDDTNLTAESVVGGTATGVITLSSIPEVSVIEADGIITVTGIRPTTGNITGEFFITVTRGGISEVLTININLSALPDTGWSIDGETVVSDIWIPGVMYYLVDGEPLTNTWAGNDEVGIRYFGEDGKMYINQIYVMQIDEWISESDLEEIFDMLLVKFNETGARDGMFVTGEHATGLFEFNNNLVYFVGGFAYRNWVLVSADIIAFNCVETESAAIGPQLIKNPWFGLDVGLWDGDTSEEIWFFFGIDGARLHYYSLAETTDTDALSGTWLYMGTHPSPSTGHHQPAPDPY